MSYNRNIKWLNDKHVIYRRDPVNDVPTVETAHCVITCLTARLR